MTTFVDSAGAVKEWINSLTATLVGEGKPLPLGASLKQREGAASVAYGFLMELPTSVWGGTENPSMASYLSMQVYGPSREAAAAGAVAYAEALVPLSLGQAVTTPSGVVILGVEDIRSPYWQPDFNEPRYIVDARFLFA